MTPEEAVHNKQTYDATVHRMNRAQDALVRQLDRSRDKVAELRADIDIRLQDYADLNVENNKRRSELGICQDKLHQRQRDNDNQLLTIQNFDLTIRDLKKVNAELRAEIITQKTRIDPQLLSRCLQAEAEVKRLTAHAAKVDGMWNDDRRAMVQLEAERDLRSSELVGKHTALMAERQGHQATHTHLRNMLARLQATIDTPRSKS